MSAEWLPITTAPRDGSAVQLRSQAFGASPLPFQWDAVKRGWRKGNWLQWWFEDALGPEEWRPYTMTAPAIKVGETVALIDAAIIALRMASRKAKELYPDSGHPGTTRHKHIDDAVRNLLEDIEVQWLIGGRDGSATAFLAESIRTLSKRVAAMPKADESDIAFAMRVAGYVRDAACLAEAGMALQSLAALARLGAATRPFASDTSVAGGQGA